MQPVDEQRAEILILILNFTDTAKILFFPYNYVLRLKDKVNCTTGFIPVDKMKHNPEKENIAMWLYAG